MSPYFSKRLPASYTDNALIAVLEEKKRRGEKLVDLTVSNPTQVGIAYPDAVGAYAQALGLTYDPHPQGLASARAAIAERYYRRRGLDVIADNLFITASSSESYQYLFKLLADPGEGILVPEPSYPLFDSLLALEAVVKVPYYFVYRDGRWALDVEGLKATLCAPAPRVKAIVLVNPNNPTGAFLSHEEWEAVIVLCQKSNLAMICDEVFWDYASSTLPRRSGVSCASVLTFTLNGLSKAMGLPGLKLGWVYASGPERLVKEAKAHLEFISDCYLSVSTPVQRALPALFELRIHEHIARRVNENRKMLQAMFPHPFPLALYPGDGGWSALFRLPDDCSDAKLCERLLKEHNVWIYPGYFFDFREGEWLVTSLLPAPKVLQEGMLLLKGLFQ